MGNQALVPPGLSPRRPEWSPLRTWADGDAAVHVLVAALDGGSPAQPLRCSTSGVNFEELARASAAHGLEVLLNEQCTKERVLGAIESLGERCRPEDCFLLYFSGHGATLGGGETGEPQEQAFRLAPPAQPGTTPALAAEELHLRNGLLARTLARHLCPGVKVLIVTDCCHTGTIVDLALDEWDNRQALAVSGCIEAEAFGPSGLFTHALLYAIDALRGTPRYSVGALYKAVQQENSRIFGGAQGVAIQASRGTASRDFVWPLVPEASYQSPLARAAAAAGALVDSRKGGAGGSCCRATGARGTRATSRAAMHELQARDPDALPRLGLQPEALPFVAKGPAVTGPRGSRARPREAPPCMLQ